MVKFPNFVAKVSGINEFQTHHFQRYVLALSFPIYRMSLYLPTQGAVVKIK